MVSASSVQSFVDFDERLVSAEAGVVVVRGSIDVHASLVAHARRRLRTSGFRIVDAFTCAGTPLFREVALHLGVGTASFDPSTYADTIAAAAGAQRAAIVASLPPEGTWDHAVALELTNHRGFLLVFVTASEASLGDASVFELSAELGVQDKLRWLAALAEETHRALPAADLRALEEWWSKARRGGPEGTLALGDLGDASRRILTSLALARRSLPLSALASRMPCTSAELTAAVGDLVAAGLATRTGDLLSAAPSRDLPVLAASASVEVRLAVAGCLAGDARGVDSDPWALAHAAELFVTAGAFEDADAAMSKALKVGADSLINAEISTRWFDVVTPIVGSVGLMLRTRGAERALLLGESADAQRWCESASVLEPNDPTILALMGRTLMQRGDLVAARVSLSKAEMYAPKDDADFIARIAAEHAELSYLAGELAQASVHATRAIDLATTVSTRLAGRSTLGKLLLARCAWDLADEHFAQDALAASSAGQITAELRARLNRAIALLSKGQLDGARVLLERVLEDATRLKEERARAYAFSNLGTVAYRQHDYRAALHYFEVTSRFPHALCGRLSTAVTIGNLAELRLRLGLVDHAEHAIVFGKKLFAGSAPPRYSSMFKWVSAQIALARKSTELARRQVEAALVDAEASGDRHYVEAAHIVGARVALEDGDLLHLREALDAAEAVATSPRACAEVAIIRAAHLRALGQPALDCAHRALQIARASGEEDLLSEIHILLATIHGDAGDMDAARAHCSCAVGVREQVASGLPADIRAAFLAKPENVALARLQASLARDGAVEEIPTARTVVAHSDGREMVGDTPAMRGLASAIRKVARSNSTVLIQGESGTGKELVANALHRASNRASGPMVSVNCAALVETLLLSELFGHEKGAFTGASARRRGRFEMAEGGTLFLDEIGDISPRTQVSLLRVLQEKTFERVGGTTLLHANVRVVCATHRDLRAMVDRGDFREDLYYRLCGITLMVPALRARLGDLPKIAAQLLGRIAMERGEEQKRLSEDAIDLFFRYRWPGNIRELDNVLRAVSLFAEGDVITASDVIAHVDEFRLTTRNQDYGAGRATEPSARSANGAPPSSTSGPLSSSSSIGMDEDGGNGVLPEDETDATAVAYAQVRTGAVSLSDIKRQIERDCIARALAESNGNITHAAALLGMKRPRISQLVKQYGLLSISSEGNP